MFSVQSPCTGVCKLNFESVCIGCGRGIDEIMEWSKASEPRRQQIVNKAVVRLAVLNAKTPEESSR